jgi:alpha-N-arabinofuranosidase
MRRPANHIRLKVEEYQDYENRIPALKAKPVPICLDEWAYSGGPPNSYKVVPAYAWAFHEMFRHSDLYQMACFTFATAMYSASRSEAVLNPTGLMFKMYRDHFGTIPVVVSGNSPQPKPTDPSGGEQPSINAGSDTFPLDVAAALTSDRKALTIAVINTTDTDQKLELHFANLSLSRKGTLWRLAPKSLLATRQVGAKSEVELQSIPLESALTSVLLPKFSISIYELQIR